MWPLAIVVGIVANVVAWFLAERCQGGGWQAYTTGAVASARRVDCDRRRAPPILVSAET
jgi:hypothetical protein